MRYSKLRNWRRTHRLTLAEVSDLTGLSIPMLSCVERGERRLSRHAKVLMARRLGASIGQLFEIEPMEDKKGVAT